MKSTRLSLSPTTLPIHVCMLLIGADGEDGDKGKQGDPSNGGAGGGSSADDKDDKSKTGGAGDDDPAQKKIRALEEEKDRHWKAKGDAEKARDDALAELQKLTDKDKSELEIAKRDLEKQTSENAALMETNKGLALENAFLKDNTYQWHNPKRALASADLTSVEIKKDGAVVGLKEALDKLARDEPYLLKPKDNDGDGADDGKGKPPKSGAAPGGRQRQAAGGDRKVLESKYPALRGRGGR